MELLSLQIGSWRSISGLDLEPSALTVLFGGNDAGKSNLLDALEELFGESTGGDDYLQIGHALFRLDGADVPGHPDQSFLLSLLRYREPQGSLVDAAGVAADPGFFRSALKQFIGRVTDELESHGEVAARMLHRELSGQPIVGYFPEGVLLCVNRASLTDEELLAAQSLRGLWLESGENVSRVDNPIPLIPLADTDEQSPEELLAELPPSPMIGRTVRVESEPAGLDLDLQKRLCHLHNEIWRQVALMGHPQIGKGVSLRIFPSVDSMIPPGNGVPDGWLESEGTSVRPAWSILPILKLIEDHANRLSPEFVRSAGSIRLDLIPIAAWGSSGSRCRVDFELRSGEVIVEERLASGLRRWVAASIREACRSLVGATTLLIDPETGQEIAGELSGFSPRPKQDYRPRAQALLRAKAALLAKPDTRVVGCRLGQTEGTASILLVDEPEAHLHPKAQEEIAGWISEMSRRYTHTFLATHSLHFLNLPTELATFCLVYREAGKTQLQVLGDDLIGGLEIAGDQLGVDRAAVLLLTRGVLMVEGHHDQLVIDHFFGGELKRRRILLLPLRGAVNAKSLRLYESGFLERLGVPLRFVFDLPRKSTSIEAKALLEVQSLRERGYDAREFVYSEPDVICALPGEAIERAFPNSQFNGWDELVKHGPEYGFKEFALREIGIDSSVLPTEFIELVLRQVERGETPSVALQETMKDVLSSFSNPLEDELRAEGLEVNQGLVDGT